MAPVSCPQKPPLQGQLQLTELGFKGLFHQWGEGGRATCLKFLEAFQTGWMLPVHLKWLTMWQNFSPHLVFRMHALEFGYLFSKSPMFPFLLVREMEKLSPKHCVGGIQCAVAHAGWGLQPGVNRSGKGVHYHKCWDHSPLQKGPEPCNQIRKQISPLNAWRGKKKEKKNRRKEPYSLS